jgi:hypothetical protein
VINKPSWFANTKHGLAVRNKGYIISVDKEDAGTEPNYFFLLIYCAAQSLSNFPNTASG